MPLQVPASSTKFQSNFLNSHLSAMFLPPQWGARLKNRTAKMAFVALGPYGSGSTAGPSRRHRLSDNWQCREGKEHHQVIALLRYLSRKPGEDRDKSIYYTNISEVCRLLSTPTRGWHYPLPVLANHQIFVCSKKSSLF